MQILKNCISYIPFLRKLLEEAFKQEERVNQESRGMGNTGNPTQRGAKGIPGMQKGGPKMSRQRQRGADEHTGCVDRVISYLPAAVLVSHVSIGGVQVSLSCPCGH